MEPYPLTFTPILKEKVWGGRTLEKFGKHLPANCSIGESWELADLPASIQDGRSVISNGPLAGNTLEGNFPLLIKFLDACDNLSVQVHPSVAYAKSHQEAHLKSEAWIILDTTPEGRIYVGLREGTTEETLRTSLANDTVPELLNAIDVKKGECLGIVGRNGSGKTTLLRILSNIYQPDSGSVETNGIVVPVLALGLGFHPDLTAITNIYQSSILLGISKKQIKEKIDDIIKFAELEKFADTKLKNFSSGMAMRLAFATAVQVDPAVLLLDEVIAVGDVNFQKKCLAVMQDFKKRGKSIVLVSHSSTSIKELCDRAMFLKDGSIETIGHPNDVIDSYETYMSKLEK